MIHWGIVFIIASLSFMAGWIIKGRLSRESAATDLFIQMDEAEEASEIPEELRLNQI